MDDVTIRLASDDDRLAIRAYLKQHWGSTMVVSRGIAHQADDCPAFVAVQSDRLVGLLTFRIDGDECEVVSLNSDLANQGIGTRLLEHLKCHLVETTCRRLWLITTNDNLHALGFYQKRGFELVTLRRNALEYVRKLKPHVPLIGNNGIPLRDEIELEMMLGGARASRNEAQSSTEKA